MNHLIIPPKRTRHSLFYIAFFMLLTGCSSSEYQGRGESFALANRHILELDLSTLKPSKAAQTTLSAAALARKKALAQSQVSEKDASPTTDKMYRFTLKAGESYRMAIRRWSTKVGYKNVVWSMKDMGMEAMNGLQSTSVDYHGTLKKVISDVAATLNVPIHLTASEQDHILGLYDFDEEPKLTHIKGESLKGVVRNVVSNYGLHWSDDTDESRSWLAMNDYKFGADYYLLTREHDINAALSVVLSHYPVRSSILESTNQVFILEEN
ncbi:hypothetical protein [Aliivibrio fischeri]|uniref:hypothetical protein n=1 Tax=Aliivibrio fischeri TaxID=668 RepID=UPI0011468026|nr:hypothetical protein [Aliivibrio fischeri]